MNKEWKNKCDICKLHFPCKSSLLIHQLEEHDINNQQSTEKSVKVKSNISVTE